MADTVTNDTIFDGSRRVIVHITNRSDGTGESDVVKIDVSALANGPNPSTATDTLAIEEITYSVWGFSHVLLEFDATTDDEIAVLQGQGYLDFRPFGRKVDPKSTGSTGDLLLTTTGGATGSGYDILISAYKV